jgi:hypothetical protein
MFQRGLQRVFMMTAGSANGDDYLGLWASIRLWFDELGSRAMLIKLGKHLLNILNTGMHGDGRQKNWQLNEARNRVPIQKEEPMK